MSAETPIPEPSPCRPASPPMTGAIRGGIASGAATVIVGAIGVSSPELSVLYIAAGTGLLSGLGKVSRDYLANPQPGPVGALKSVLAYAFAWLG